MKLLFITPYIPYPLDSGGNQAFFSMIDNLRTKHSVNILIPVHESGYWKISSLKKLWPDVEFHVFNHVTSRGEPARKPFNTLKYRIISYLSDSFRRKKVRAIRKIYRRCTDTVTALSSKYLYGMNEPKTFPDSFYKYVYEVSRQGYDAIQVEFCSLMDLCYYLPHGVPKIFMHHEIGFVRMKNELDLNKNTGIGEAVFLEQSKDREISMLKRYDYIFVLTETDRKILARFIPEERIYTSPAIIFNSMATQYTFRNCRDEFVFVGGSDHFPNQDGILWFCENVIPALRSKGFDFKLYVTGKWNRYISRKIHKQYPEVCFVGFIEDICKFLNGKISIIPIRIGSGMRMKILEAINSRSPFITTVKGVEGQNFTNGRDCLVEDNPEEFAKAMMRLASDPELQEELTRHASAKAASIYDPYSMLKRREELYDRILCGDEKYIIYSAPTSGYLS